MHFACRHMSSCADEGAPAVRDLGITGRVLRTSHEASVAIRKMFRAEHARWAEQLTSPREAIASTASPFAATPSSFTMSSFRVNLPFTCSVAY